MTLIEDVPLPEMPEPPTLWAVHVQGPDDVIAAVDKTEADTHAKQINDGYEAFTRRADHIPELDPKWHAEVIEWPGTPAGHAEELARGDQRWEW